MNLRRVDRDAIPELRDGPRVLGAMPVPTVVFRKPEPGFRSGRPGFPEPAEKVGHAPGGDGRTNRTARVPHFPRRPVRGTLLRRESCFRCGSPVRRKFVCVSLFAESETPSSLWITGETQAGLRITLCRK